jgi:adenylate cyclase
MVRVVTVDRLRKYQLALICAIATAGVLFATLATGRLYGFGWLERWEMGFRDFLVIHGRNNPPDPRLVFVGIDNESVSIEEVDLNSLFADVPRESTDFRALSLMSRQWPWPREIHALLLDKLRAAGARVVVFDLMFPKPAADDEIFRAALDRHRDHVIIGSNFVPPSLAEGMGAAELSIPTPSLVPQTKPLDPRVAFVNFIPDGVDEVIRRAQFRLTAERFRPNFQRTPNSEVYLSLAARAVTQAGWGELVPPTTDADWLFRYTAPAGKGYRPLSAYQVFVPKYWQANFGGGERIRDNIVLIGPSGNWTQDHHETPFGQMPGPEIHLNAMNALLHRAFLAETPLWIDLLLVLLAGGAAWLVSLRPPKPALQVLRALTGNGIGVLLALGAYNFLDSYLPIVAPLLAYNLSGGSSFVYEFIRERIDKARTRRMLERYVSKDVVHELLDNRESLLHALGGTRRSITILFSDVRSFTTLTESADAVQLVTQLNQYFDQMVQTVFANAGTLDKFIGDGLMAHWGSIVSAGGQIDATHAVKSGLQMRAALARLNVEWKARGWPVLEFGIGINSGEAIVGNLGCEEKMEVSVIGDPVNLASRIEGATKQYGLDLLIGDSVADLIGDAFVLRTVDLLRVKGKTRPVEVFTVLGERDPNTAPLEWLVLYEDAVRHYRQRKFSEAVQLCEAAARLRPNDRLIEDYRHRAEVYAIQPPGPEWTGVYVMTQK